MVHRVNFQLYAFKIFYHILFRNIRPKEFVNPFRGIGNLPCGTRSGIIVHNAGHNLARAQKLYQMRRAVCRINCQIRVNALFIFAGSVCTQACFFCRDTNVGTIKACTLEQYRLRAFHNFGIFAAHYARNTDCLFRIRNHQHGRVKLAYVPVQRGNCFAFLCIPDDNMAVLDCFNAERMHGVPHLQHDIVCNVNDIVDGTHTSRTQTFAHPSGGRPDFYIFYHSRNISGAKHGILNINLYHVLRTPFAFLLYGKLGIFERDIVCRRRFPGNADNAVTVRTIGCNFKFHNVILQIHCFCNVKPQFHRLRKQVNTIFRCFGEIVTVKAKLLNGAHHAFGNHAAEIAGINFRSVSQHGMIQCNRHVIPFFYIRRAGNNRQFLPAANFDFAYHQLIRMGMFFNLVDAAGHNVFDFAAHRYSPFYLGTAHRHIFHKIFQIRRHRRIFFQPRHRYIHECILLSIVVYIRTVSGISYHFQTAGAGL